MNTNNIAIWALNIKLSKALKAGSDLYLSDLYMLSAVFIETDKLGTPLSKEDLHKVYPSVFWQLDKSLDRLIGLGYIDDLRQAGKRYRKLTLTPRGEQILMKYEKIMSQMIDEYKPL